jgi:hypothetical protein
VPCGPGSLFNRRPDLPVYSHVDVSGTSQVPRRATGGKRALGLGRRKLGLHHVDHQLDREGGRQHTVAVVL